MWADSSPSLAPYTAAGVAGTGAQPAIAKGTLLRSGGAETVQEELAAGGGFTLAPGLHAAPPNHANNAAPGGQRWTTPSPEPHAPSPSPPTPRAQVGPPAAAAALDLERGMTSPWQGPSDGVDGHGNEKAAGVGPPPGMMEAAVGVSPETIGTALEVLGTERGRGGGGGGGGGRLARGAARQEVVARGAERGQGVHQHQQRHRQGEQVAPKTAGPVAAQKVRIANVAPLHTIEKCPVLQRAASRLFTCFDTGCLIGSAGTREREARCVFHAKGPVCGILAVNVTASPCHRQCHTMPSTVARTPDLSGRRRILRHHGPILRDHGHADMHTCTSAEVFGHAAAQ